MRIKIYLYCPEKIPAFYKKAIAEYEKRLGRYCRIELKIINREKDWDRTLSGAGEGFYLLPGASCTSEEFSGQIGKWESESRKEIPFYVDPSCRPETIPEQMTAFSISRFQMNGPMTALILYEQIYRGYRILHNHPYHK